MERTLRLLVVAGAVSLLGAHLVIGRAWSGMMATATTLGLAAAAGAVFTPSVVGGLALASCLVPPIVWATLETFSVQFWVPWMAALLGAMLPGLLASPPGVADVPPRFRVPLLAAGLAVVVGALLVSLREIDFNLALLGDMPGAVLSGLPWFSVEWTLQVAVTTLIGILWFEWLVLTPQLDVERWVIVPLTVSLAISAAVGVYQMFVDVTFLNATVYGGIGRASGTMFDANVAGVLAAVGIGFTAYLATGRPRSRAWLALLPVFGLAVWASGSRTGAGATGVVVLISGLSWWRHAGGVGTRLSRRRLMAVGVVAMLAIGLAAPWLATTTVGPVQRFRDMWPDRATPTHTLTAMLTELWNRNGYGAAATTIIDRFPLTGVGIGSFHLFGPRLTPTGPLPPDNAQNWLRHQLAEMGMLGAFGWVMFSATFGWFVVRPWHGGDARVNHLRAIVLAFAMISLLGMPTQEVIPAVAFWTAAAVLVRIDRQRRVDAAVAAAVTSRLEPAAPSRWVIAGIAVVTLAFGLATWQVAHTRLRVPVRAREFGWPFAYGFYEPEAGQGSDAERWMAGRATALVDVHGPFLQVTLRSPFPDLEQHPLHVRAWVEGREVIDAQLRSGEPTRGTARVPAGLTKVVLDVAVSRTMQPSALDPASHDSRELGALVAWRSAARER